MISNKNISNEKIMKLIDLYFNERFIMYKMQYDSYSQFINEIVYKTLTENFYFNKKPCIKSQSNNTGFRFV